MQMMQNNHAVDITLQEAEPILDITVMNNSTISSQPRSQSNCLKHTIMIMTKTQSKIKLSHTQQMINRNTQTWQDRLLKTLNKDHSTDDNSEYINNRKLI